jgi:hypothetical protein
MTNRYVPGIPNNAASPNQNTAANTVNSNVGTNTPTNLGIQPLQQGQPSAVVELYKCETGGPIAFFGCLRCRDAKQ